MPETYDPYTWTNGVTPITDARLNAIETGIESMDDRVTALEGGTAAEIVPTLTFGSTGAAAANTTALATAIASAVTSGRSVRVVGAGSVYVNPVTVTAGVRLVVDLGVVLTNNDPASGSCLTAGTNTVIDGYGTIDGNRAASPSSSASRGVEVTGAGAVVRNVTIRQTAGAGVYLAAGADSCAVLNTTLLDNGREGIVANLSGTTSATDFTLIDGNRIERSGRQVVDALGSEGASIKAFGDSVTHVLGPEALRIVNNHVVDPAAGECCIELWGFGRHTLINNNHTRGGYIGISVDACQYVTVTGNTCFDHSDLGIELAGSYRGTCTGNIVNGNGNTHTGISITSSDVSNQGESLSCVGNIVTNLDTSATAAFGGPSRCVNVQDMSRVIVGPGNIFTPPTSGYGVRIQSLSTLYDMYSIKVIGNVVQGGARGVQIYNDTGDASTLARIVIESNSFEDCTTGIDYDRCTNTYVSGNKFLNCTTVKSGLSWITGDNDWQANFPRSANT